MGTQDVRNQSDAEERREFTKLLLNDLRALEHLLEHDQIESDVRRIGAEQELFLVDQSWRAASIARDVLATIDDPHFTTELAKFNLEFNCDPLVYEGTCLRDLNQQLDDYLDVARRAAEEHGARVVLAGILPTLHKSDLDLANMTDNPRYFALNDALGRERGDAYTFMIRGTDELSFKHYSVMLEACNTSFQVHFQVAPNEFAKLYNIAQVVTAPVVAAATNSPLLFGKRLWRETRIALFQQSLDTRTAGHHLREIKPRVSFGNAWVDESVLEIFREDISRFRVLLSTDVGADPFELLRRGEVPALRALLLHNSTVYRWNRPCYGITSGVPHLRIENRVLPAGPSTVDEVANAAFWFGLISGLASQYDDIRSKISFDAAKDNFFAAARFGTNTQLQWLGQSRVNAQSLIVDELVPLARHGLHVSGLDSSDADRYLGIIEERVRSDRTGSSWILTSFEGMSDPGLTQGERLTALVAGSIDRQERGLPVHEWTPAESSESGGWKNNFRSVEQFMTTDLYTVNEEESIDLVANLMDWRHIRHVPVEDHQHRLVGLVSYRALIRYLARSGGADKRALPVREIMKQNLITITPETSSLDAIELMTSRRISCLPVLKEDRLVGIVTDVDFTQVARQLLQETLRQ